MTAKSKAVARTVTGATVDPFQIVNALIDVTNDFLKERERASVARAEIAAWEAVQLEKIRAQREVLLEALRLTFDERRGNFSKLFVTLDRMLVAGDIAGAAAVLDSITELAKESPFKELADLEIVTAELQRSDKVWDV